MPTLDFVSMVQNLEGTVVMGGPLWLLVTAICWIMASAFGVLSLTQLKAAAEDGRGSFRAPLMTFVGAVLMASSPSFLSSIVATAYGDDMWGSSPLSTVVGGASGGTFKAVLSMVSFIGYCFFVRGIWVLKESGEPQRYHSSTVGKAIAILFAGMAAIYIDTTLKMFSNTFGWDISTYIS